MTFCILRVSFSIRIRSLYMLFYLYIWYSWYKFLGQNLLAKIFAIFFGENLANWDTSSLSFLGISPVYLSLLKVKTDNFGLLTNIADTPIAKSSATSRSFLFAKLLFVFLKTILNSNVF